MQLMQSVLAVLALGQVSPYLTFTSHCENSCYACLGVAGDVVRWPRTSL